MDALALLCNLHADGPTTLSVLREAGCDSVSGLFEKEPLWFGEAFGWADARTRRFLREARVLQERLHGDGLLAPLEPGDPGDPDPTTPAAVDRADHAEQAEKAEQADESFQPEPSRNASAPLESASRKSRGRRHSERRTDVAGILGTWQRLDVESPPVDPEVLIPKARSAAPGFRAGTGAGVPLAKVVEPWLTDELRGRLLAAGYEDLEPVVNTDALALAEELGLGLTRCLRLQALARRLVPSA